MYGVKQGGVLSPVVVCIYMDDLLTSLKCADHGCYVGHVFVGALAYADDIVLLAPTQQCLIPVSLKHDGPTGQRMGQRGSDPSALLQAN